MHDYGDGKLLRHSIFSTAGSFGWALCILALAHLHCALLHACIYALCVHLRSFASFCIHLCLGTKAFSSTRGLFFHGKGASRSPNCKRTPPPLGPSPQGRFTENPSRGSPKKGGEGPGGAGGLYVEFGERARPLYREKKAPLR